LNLRLTIRSNKDGIRLAIRNLWLYCHNGGSWIVLAAPAFNPDGYLGWLPSSLRDWSGDFDADGMSFSSHPASSIHKYTEMMKFQPFIAIQSVLEGSDVAIATSLIMFTQFLGTAVFLALANTIFNNSIGSELHKHAPTVNAEQVIQAGATEFRELVSDQQLPGILQAYANSVDRVFYLVAGAGALSVLTVWGMGWVDIRQKKETTPEAEAVSATASPLPRPHAGH
jgi:hypothetical protein